MSFFSKIKKIIKRNNQEVLVGLSCELKEIMRNIDFPILIISYNNAVYVESMVRQLNEYGIKPIVIDNNSNDEYSIDILKKINGDDKANVIFSPINFGYRVGFMSPIYDVLPNFFAYTDPDLKFNSNMPSCFIEDFKKITEKYKIFKVGCALSLSDGLSENIYMEFASMKKPINTPLKKYSVKDWDSRYWRIPIRDDNFELYSAPIDTTFAVYNKDFYYNNIYDAIRVAGDYSVLHLPWYPNEDIMNKKQKEVYLSGNNSNTWKE